MSINAIRKANSFVRRYRGECNAYAKTSPAPIPVPQIDPIDDDEEEREGLARLERADPQGFALLKERFPDEYTPGARKRLMSRPPFAYSILEHADLDICPPLSLAPETGELTRVPLYKYANLIRSPQFQRISKVIQLSQVDATECGADHRRGEHSLMAAYFAGQIADHLKLDECNKALVQIDALFHDIGHPAWGHCAENLIRKQGFDHEQEGIRIVKELHKHIEAHVNLEDVIAMLEERHPLSSVIHGAYGADRIAYLLRDLELTRKYWHEPYYLFRTDPNELIENTVLSGHEGNAVLAVKENSIDIASDFLMSRALAYTKIYHNPNVQILQRYAHRVLEASGLADPTILTSIDDKQLKELLQFHEDSKVRQLYQHYVDLARIPCTAYGLDLGIRTGDSTEEPCGEPKGFTELCGEWAYRLNVPRGDYFRKISIEQAAVLGEKFKDTEIVSRLESHVAVHLSRMLGKKVEPDAVAVVVPTNIHKSRPDFAPIATAGGVKNLYDLRPTKREAMERLARRHWAFRICVPEEVREESIYYLRREYTVERLMDI